MIRINLEGGKVAYTNRLTAGQAEAARDAGVTILIGGPKERTAAEEAAGADYPAERKIAADQIVSAVQVSYGEATQ